MVVLAAGIVGSIGWLVWYDMSKAYTAPSVGERDPDSLWSLSARDVQADIGRVRTSIRSNGFWGSIFARFHLRAGRYPDRLEDLLKRPPGLDPSLWDGPYVNTPDMLNDPWGRPYRYRHPGMHNEDGYDLWSVGLDGADGTADDICNW